MSFKKISRRTLLLALGGASVSAGAAALCFAVYRQRQQRWAKAVDRGSLFSPSAYLTISDDDVVTIYLTKTEMGQGVMTALPAIVAEELDANWDQVHVKIVALTKDVDYGSMFTAASSSVTSTWTELRKAGASARDMLLRAGAAHLNASADDCTTSKGRVMRNGTADSVTYGEVARAAARLSPPFRPTLKDPTKFEIIGKSVPRVDIPDKVRGAARYGIDARIDGAVTVAVEHCPVIGGTVKALDDSRAKGIAGFVQVVPLPNAVAVAATNTWAALEGLRTLEVTWDVGEYRPSSDDLKRQILAALDSPGLLVAESGPVNLATAGTIEAKYDVPFLAHAQMEPLNSSVVIKGDHCELWVSTQNPEAVRDVAARILEIPLENVIVHRTLVGGGFGRRTHTDETEDAVRVAKQLGRPVHLVWSREEDTRQGVYREMAAHKLRGALSSDGRKLLLHHRIASATFQERPEQATEADGIAVMGSTDVPYAQGAFRVEWTGVRSPVRVGILRSVGYSHNTFAIESFMDELARSGDIDPVRLRLKLLPSDSRLRRCIEQVATMSGWGQRKNLGIAACSCFGSHVALVVEVAQGESDRIRVAKIWVAADCGLQLHPDNIKAQIEGGIVFGLSASLSGRVGITDGAVVTSNFHDYPVARQSDVPQIEVKLIESAEAPGGVGELSVPVVAPALCNALFQATGVRHRSLPLIG